MTVDMVTFEPQHNKANTKKCAPSEDSDQPAQSDCCLPEEALGPLIAQQRLIWVFAGHVILLVLSCSGYSNILHSPL